MPFAWPHAFCTDLTDVRSSLNQGRVSEFDKGNLYPLSSSNPSAPCQEFCTLLALALVSPVLGIWCWLGDFFASYAVSPDLTLQIPDGLVEGIAVLACDQVVVLSSLEDFRQVVGMQRLHTVCRGVEVQV